MKGPIIMGKVILSRLVVIQTNMCTWAVKWNQSCIWGSWKLIWQDWALGLGLVFWQYQIMYIQASKSTQCPAFVVEITIIFKSSVTSEKIVGCCITPETNEFQSVVCILCDRIDEWVRIVKKSQLLSSFQQCLYDSILKPQFSKITQRENVFDLSCGEPGSNCLLPNKIIVEINTAKRVAFR